jgi:DnaK suppressor protein
VQSGKSAILDGGIQVSYREISGRYGEFSDFQPGITMTKADLEVYKQQLLHLQNRLNGDVSHLTSEALGKGDSGGGNLSHMPIHMADLGSDAFEQENTLSLLANEQERLTEIGDALDRVKQGKFGRCEECEEEIPKARLKELPWARHCVACARKIEKRSR